jgi:transitional endoplasmic reticulum ATPase
MDLGRVDPAKVIYSEAVTTQLEASIWSRLRHPEALRRLGVSLKKSVLLFGKYGVGKTLAAYLTAQEAVKAEQTFILVRPGKDSIEQAIALAGMYEPAVVFCEDVDRIASGDEENGRITELLELFDGARAKGREIMVILTTNFVESIHKGMMRPGRLDAVIEITAPDRDGSVRLLRTLVPDEAIDTTITKAEWDKVGEAMDGYLPAFIAAVAERAASYLTVRVGGEIDGKKLKAEDFIEAANGLRVQESLMEGAKDVPEDRGLGQAMADVVTGVVRTEIVEHVLNVPSDN